MKGPTAGKDLIIGIDAGTSVIKSIAFNMDGKLVDSASINNEYHLLDGGGACLLYTSPSPRDS